MKKSFLFALVSLALVGTAYAGTINPYTHLDMDRAAIEAAFPHLSKVEVDKLLFQIADINSMK